MDDAILIKLYKEQNWLVYKSKLSFQDSAKLSSSVEKNQRKKYMTGK